MNNQELAQVLAKANVIDARLVVDEAVFAAWGELIGDLEVQDALDAVAEHYRSSTNRIMPKDIRDNAKRIAHTRYQRQRQLENRQEALDALADDIALTETEFWKDEHSRRIQEWLPHKPRDWQDHLRYLEQQKLNYPTWYAAAEERVQNRLEAVSS